MLNIKNQSSIMNSQEILDHLSSQFIDNKLGHATIITGNDNLNKKNIIYQFLEKILPNIKHLSSRLNIGSFPDVLTINKADKNEITIDEIRKIINFCSLSPIEASFKIIIIEEAELLNLNASNALLKILEEPIGNTFIFLLAAKSYQLLPTIKSRCQKITLKNSNTDFISDYELYRECLILLEKNDFISWGNFLDKFLGKKTEDNWLNIKIVFQEILRRIIKTKINIDSFIADEEEEKLLKAIANKKEIEFWLDVNDEMEEFYHNLDIFNLDKKQTLTWLFDRVK